MDYPKELKEGYSKGKLKSGNFGATPDDIRQLTGMDTYNLQWEVIKYNLKVPFRLGTGIASTMLLIEGKSYTTTESQKMLLLLHFTSHKDTQRNRERQTDRQSKMASHFRNRERQTDNQTDRKMA